MPNDISSLVKEHHAFYEVSPYYIELDERPVGHPASCRSVQAGFNVDVYAVRTEDDEPTMPEPSKYGLGYVELQKLAEKVSQHSSDSTCLEVIPFSSTAIIDSRNRGQVEYLIRIQISHDRGLDQPAGPPEKRALEEVEEELNSLGIAHR
jgi:hypothetical protein